MESKFSFLTKYSLKKKIKAKGFIIANIIVAIIVIGLMNIDTIIKSFGGDFSDDVKIKIVDNVGYYNDVKEGIKQVVGYTVESKVIIKKEEDIKSAKKKIKDTKEILLVLIEDKDNIFKVEFISDSYVDTLRYQAITSGINTAKSSIALKNSNINPEELAKISKPVEIKRTFIDNDKTDAEEKTKTVLSILSMLVSLPCFMLIVYLVQMIGAEINEEKATRGMEIIIGNVSAKTHFFSKVLASNIFVLLQGGLLLLYSGIGFIIRKITAPPAPKIVETATSEFDVNYVISIIKESGIISKLGYILPLVLIIIILSFIAYSLLSGILASMTTNMENYQQLQTPLMVINVVGYYLIIASMMFPGATFIKWISCIPLISITLAPGLALAGQIGVIHLIISIIVLMLLDFILVKYGLKVYKVGILNYSEAGLWKKMLKAIKEK